MRVRLHEGAPATTASMTTERTAFSIDHFESAVQSRDYAAAHEQFVALLNALASNRGTLGDERFARTAPDDPRNAASEAVATRICDTITTLFSDPDFNLTDNQFTQIAEARWWLKNLFGATHYRNTDHIVRALIERAPAEPTLVDTHNLISKQLLLYTSESTFDIDLAALAESDPVFAISLGMSLLAAAVVVSPAAHEKRERMIEWLPHALDAIEDLDDLPSLAVCASYMHCSYAESPKRHDVKRGINALVRRKMKSLGLMELEPDLSKWPKREKGKKPLMIVVLEWFTGGHSIYRTHSRTMLAAREHFEVVAFGAAEHVDEKGRAIFDRFIPFEHAEFVGDCVKQLFDFADEHHPEVLYMPSVGMFTHTVFVSNLRFAPLQIAGLGHPATMHSGMIDYVSVEDDFVGDPACFSEKMMRLPKDGQPYVPSALIEGVTPSVPPRRETVRIAVTASAMKLNPRFLEACREIVRKSPMPVTFHFMTSWSDGIELAYLRRMLHQTLPESCAYVYGSLDYPVYLEVINMMDMFVSPFPFGNTNGIVDSFTVGLPGINLCGREVFEHIDSGLFTRAGLPSWLTAHSVDEYVGAAVRLANEHEEREALRRQLIDTQAVKRIFEGRPEAFGEQILKLVTQRKKA